MPKMQKLNKRRYVGELCKWGHYYKNTGGSLRYKGCRTCCTCNALSVLDRKGEHEIYRDTPCNKKKMAEYQLDYHKNYRSKNKKVLP